MFSTDNLEEALTLLGHTLLDRGQRFEVVAIGGGGLLLLGIIERPTKDLDLVALIANDRLVHVEQGLPPELSEAIADVARVLGLRDDWMNEGPSSMPRLGLPAGFQDRLERREYSGLVVYLASRFDQIHFKLYAAADGGPGGKHHVDLQRLKPTREELLTAARWATTHEARPEEGFAQILAGVLRTFGVVDAI